MTNFAQDREIERQRYNDRATQQLRASRAALGADGAEAVDILLRRPYLVYERHISNAARPDLVVLDVCCGDGIHSLTAARLGATVTATDIAEHNLAVARQRASRAGLRLHTIAANAENLPLPAASFDIITCAGSLSYVDLERFLGELCRLLKPHGTFIFVDSLNHNPIYRFNRWLHNIRGQRSRSTLERMPTLATLKRIRAFFPDLQVSYHGVFSFLAPLLGLFGHARAARWLDSLDSALPHLQRFAFKVVGVGRRSSAKQEPAEPPVRESGPGFRQTPGIVFSHYLFSYSDISRPQLPDAGPAKVISEYASFPNVFIFLSPTNFRCCIVGWWLICFVHGFWRYPHLFIIRKGKKIVHYSFLLPSIGRIRVAWQGDLEIGPCWTHPEYRRIGYFEYAINRLRYDFWHPDRKFWMLCRKQNAAPQSGIVNAGFVETARCVRLKRRLIPGHYYQVMSPPTDTTA